MNVEAPSKNVVMELNRFLKGIHMGIDAFDHLQHKTKDEGLRRSLIQVQSIYLKQSNTLSKRIEELGGVPKEGLGLTGKLSEVFENLKNITVNTDEELVSEAYKACQTGFTMGDRFLEDTMNLDETTRSIIEGIVEDNKNLAQIFTNKLSVMKD